MKRFDATCTFFSKISIDNINVRVKRSKTRASDWVNLALVFGVDCSTGYFFCLPCNDLSAKSLVSALSVLFIKYSLPSEIITDAHASFRSIATNNPWPSCKIRPRQPNEQHANFVESSIRVFKSFETLLNESKLFALDLIQRIEIICATMNSRPVKRVTRSTSVFTLSSKELVIPLLSRANIRQEILHLGATLCQETNWSDYTNYKSDSQNLLQQHLLDFLYNESSWRFNALKKSNVSKDKNFLEPMPNDIVAIKREGGEDYKLGVVVCNRKSPRILVRPLTGGRQDLPYIHSLNLGLLFRDPPQPSSAEIAAENSSLERASIGIRKAFEGETECVLSTERLKMKIIHEALHVQGLSLIHI